MDGDRIEAFILSLIVLVFSISLHEFGHAIAADKLGDPGPRRDGRVTLWPGSHFDIFGFVMMCMTLVAGFGIGWGKPVMVNSRALRNPRRDMVLTASAGPVMNLLLAVVFGLLVRILIQTHSYPQGTFGSLFQYFIIINLGLMFFNLIPIHPLDGGKIMSGFLPRDLSERFDRFMWQWGPIILLFSCFSGLGILGSVIAPATMRTYLWLVGAN